MPVTPPLFIAPKAVTCNNRSSGPSSHPISVDALYLVLCCPQSNRQPEVHMGTGQVLGLSPQRHIVVWGPLTFTLSDNTWVQDIIHVQHYHLHTALWGPSVSKQQECMVGEGLTTHLLSIRRNNAYVQWWLGRSVDLPCCTPTSRREIHGHAALGMCRDSCFNQGDKLRKDVPFSPRKRAEISARAKCMDRWQKKQQQVKAELVQEPTFPCTISWIWQD